MTRDDLTEAEVRSDVEHSLAVIRKARMSAWLIGAVAAAPVLALVVVWGVV